MTPPTHPPIAAPATGLKARRVQDFNRREARAALRASKIERPRPTKAERRDEHRDEMKARRGER